MSGRKRISEARRTQILEAAVHVIGARGLADTRIADIAERTGTSSALVVYYFGTKERLLAEALSYSEERFYAQTADELAGIDSATDQLIRLLELSCAAGEPEGEWIDEWVLWLDLWSRAYRDPEVARDREAMDRRWRETIAEIVRRGQASGEFGLDADPDELALRLASLVDGLAIQVVLRDSEVTAARMFRVCVDMASRDLGFAVPARARRPRATPGRGRAATRVPVERTADV